MFAASYFAPRYFAPRYFPPDAAGSQAPSLPRSKGGGGGPGIGAGWGRSYPTSDRLLREDEEIMAFIAAFLEMIE